MKDSDINYLLQVKVVNQTLVTHDVNHFNVISKEAGGSFTEIYGDSYISGFLEGGEFYALISIKLADKSKQSAAKAGLESDLQAVTSAVSVMAKGQYDAASSLKDSAISVR